MERLLKASQGKKNILRAAELAVPGTLQWGECKTTASSVGCSSHTGCSPGLCTAMTHYNFFQTRGNKNVLCKRDEKEMGFGL